MQKRGRSFRFLGGFFVVTLGALTLVLVSLSRGPDLELHFSRTVPSLLPPIRHDRNLSALNRWPQWFFSLAKVSAETTLTQTASPTDPSSSDSSKSEISKGAVLTLQIDPNKGKWRRFELTAEVVEYIPAQRIRLKIIKDSSGRLTRLFDHLEWTVEFQPEGNGTVIRGTATAHTCHWKSRFFGRLSERILMNQIFYPDLVKLSELKQPFSTELPPQANQMGSSF